MSSTAGEWRELGRRAANGVQVSVLWSSSVNRLKVAVSDERLCHHLDFELGDAEAIDAFRQPFTDATEHLLARTDEFWGFNQSLGPTAHEEGLN
jgi:hypothetical protein